MRTIQDSKPIVALLLITISTGMLVEQFSKFDGFHRSVGTRQFCRSNRLDAISLLHLGTFTGYMTGTVILVGVHLAGGAELAWPGLVALAGFVLGAIGGGRLVRRRHPSPILVGEVLLASAALVALAAAVDVIAPNLDRHFVVIAVLAFAMGLQTSATRHAGVTDMAMPAATMILHGLAHDSHLAGGQAERVWRRVGVLAGLLAGAAVGAALSNESVPVSLFATALVAAGGGLVLRWSAA